MNGVEVRPLTEAPRELRQLTSADGMLVAWQYANYIMDKDLHFYHFAIYHSSLGWLGCRYADDVSSAMPLQIIATSQGTLWIYTSDLKVICLRLVNGERISFNVAISEPVTDLINGDEEGFWTAEGCTIKRMQLNEKNQLDVVRSYALNFSAERVLLFEDGAIGAVGREELAVLSDSGQVIYHEEGTFISYPPFILCVSEKNHLRYTQDPRQGWYKLAMHKVPYSDNGAMLTFFGAHDQTRFFAILDTRRLQTSLYRFGNGHDTEPQLVWETHCPITSFTFVNNLLCMVSGGPITIHSLENIPDNTGFLVWNPNTGVFYSNLPQQSILSAYHVLHHPIRIPLTWCEKNTKEQEASP